MAPGRAPAALLAAWALAAATPLPDDSLLVDDECHGDSEACALNALQVRGQRLEVSAANASTGACSPAYAACKGTGACCDAGFKCYMKDSEYAACLQSCTPGIHYEDPLRFQTPWSCQEFRKGEPPAGGGDHQGGGGGGGGDHQGGGGSHQGGGGGASGVCAKKWSDNCMVTRKCCDKGFKCYEKNANYAACRASCTPGANGGTCKLLPDYDAPWTPPSPAGPPAPPPPPGASPSPTPPAAAPGGGWTPASPSLLSGSTGELLTFHMYRAQNAAKYAPANVNAGNLAGIMWYIQNEIVSGDWGDTTRFGISRIIRYKVTMKATQPLVDKGMNFGVRVAFDYGLCTGPTCTYDWDTYGYNVGCNNLGEYPYPKFDTHYADGIWYSLPGVCPSRPFFSGDASCEKTEPGGLCPSGQVPTGAGDCTWNYEEEGHIELEDLYAGKSAKDFWENKWWDVANDRRVEAARQIFNSKFGPEIPAPPCDFSLDKFYLGYSGAEPYSVLGPQFMTNALR